jgi:hypothetical protein
MDKKTLRPTSMYRSVAADLSKQYKATEEYTFRLPNISIPMGVGNRKNITSLLWQPTSAEELTGSSNENVRLSRQSETMSSTSDIKGRSAGLQI